MGGQDDSRQQLSSALALVESGAAEPELTLEQLDELRQVGSERTVAAGEVLFHPGDVYNFLAIVEGRIAVIDDFRGRREQVVAERGPGGFIGEVGLLSHQLFPFTAVARDASRVIEVQTDALRRIIDEEPALSDIILRAFLVRRAKLIGQGLGLRVVGSRFSADTRRLLDFLTRNGLPFGWLDVERDPEAEGVLCDFNIAAHETPVVIAGTIVLRNPSNEALAETLGFVPNTQSTDVFDLLVVGAGPAGLAASVYGASEGLNTLAIDNIAVGGQAGTSSRIENYLGFPAGVSGRELAVRAQLQAEKFNARITVPCDAVALEQVDGMHRVRLSSGDHILARSVIIATGAQYARLPLERLAELEGVGVYYAATVAEARMCAGDSVALVGGGNSAGQAAVFLARRCKRVYVLVRRSGLSETMSRYLIHQIESHDNIEVLLQTEVRQLLGDGGITGLQIESTVDGSRRTLDVCALFVFIGAEPHTDWLAGEIALDEHGFVLTGRDLPADADGAVRLPLETSRAGVFAAGDVRSGSIKRVASAVGEGAMAVRFVYDYLNPRHPVTPQG
ncbi:MAG TPA: FAD-dependent oxidoreductase [Candidatus Acidoferrales bacterium]|nr:FAD-dependent oxidoreductase [Candidatus Acidoferrales bacterium]